MDTFCASASVFINIISKYLVIFQRIEKAKLKDMHALCKFFWEVKIYK